MKITYSDFFDLSSEANRVINRAEESDKPTELSEKLRIFSRKQLKPIGEQWDDVLRTIELEHCEKNSKGHLERDAQGRFVYKPEGWNGREKAAKEALKEEVELDLEKVSQPICAWINKVLCIDA